MSLSSWFATMCLPRASSVAPLPAIGPPVSEARPEAAGVGAASDVDALGVVFVLLCEPVSGDVTVAAGTDAEELALVDESLGVPEDSPATLAADAAGSAITGAVADAATFASDATFPRSLAATDVTEASVTVETPLATFPESPWLDADVPSGVVVDTSAVGVVDGLDVVWVDA
jgi:hypothetical protein